MGTDIAPVFFLVRIYFHIRLLGATATATVPQETIWGMVTGFLMSYYSSLDQEYGELFSPINASASIVFANYSFWKL